MSEPVQRNTDNASNAASDGWLWPVVVLAVVGLVLLVFVLATAPGYMLAGAVECWKDLQCTLSIGARSGAPSTKTMTGGNAFVTGIALASIGLLVPASVVGALLTASRLPAPLRPHRNLVAIGLVALWTAASYGLVRLATG